MLAANLTVPVPCEHDFQAHPMTSAEKLKNNAGWVQSYLLKDVTDPKTNKTTKDVLFAALDIADPDIAKKLPTTIRWTSPWISSFTDGKGREWRNVISHVALTTRPRIIKQQPFGGNAAALSHATVTDYQRDTDTWKALSGERGLCLSKAGSLTPKGLPRYPIAFSMWSGIAMAADPAETEDKKESGKYIGGVEKSAAAHKLSEETGHDEAIEHSKNAVVAAAEGNSKEASMHHMNAEHEHDGEDGEEHDAAAKAHSEAASYHMDCSKGAAMALDSTPPKKAKRPGDVDAGEEEADPSDDSAEDPAEDDEDNPAEDIDTAVGGEETPEPTDFADAASDVGMEEVLADLLGALDIHVDKSPDPTAFKRSLYNAAMTKIHELTAKGRAGDDDPNRDNPPGQPPNDPNKPPNPLIQQEQQPMYMSLADIDRLPDPVKGLALSMYHENAKATAKTAALEKKLNSLNAAKLNEERVKRTQRVLVLGRMSPRVKADLDAMLDMPSMALSIGDGGTVIDPMATTLAVLEKGLADMPRLLTIDSASLAVAAHPTDADQLTAEQEDAVAERLARKMGATG